VTDKDVAKWEEYLNRLNSADARLVLQLLAHSHQEMFDTEDFRQDLFIAHYVANKGRVKRALEATGTSYAEYGKWLKDVGFRTKFKIANEDAVFDLKTIAVEKARNGDNEMLKFILTAYEPEVFDSKVRAQRVANEGQMDAIEATNRVFTEEELRDLIKNDPAGEFQAIVDNMEKEIQ